MQRTAKGFTLFEVILYLAIFSVMALGLLMFSWNVSDLGVKERVSRQTASDARFIALRLNALIREAAAVDTGSSVFDSADGRLVLELPDTSDTVTIALSDGRVTVMGTGLDPVMLQSPSTLASELRFEYAGSPADNSEYVGFTVTVDSEQQGNARSAYDASSTVRSGATIRNQSL